jgi:F-type H+-transporting ATPase subunit epsilon
VADTLRIEITTPEKLVVDRQADYAEIPGKGGYMGILPGHAALLSELGEGKLTLTTGSKSESFAVAGGYVEVRDNHVRVLADRVD